MFRLLIFIFIIMGSSAYAQDISENNVAVSPPSTTLDVLDATNKDIKEVLRELTQRSGINIVAGPNVQGTLTLYLKDVDVRDALRIIVNTNDLAYTEQDGFIQIMTAEEYKLKFGHSFGEEIQTKIVSLTYADAKELVEVLNQVKSESGRVILNSINNNLILIDAPDNLATMETLIQEMDVPLQTERIVLRALKASEVVKLIQREFSFNYEKLTVDNETNSIVISETEKNIDEIKKFIKKIDQVDKEIQIKIKTLQITLDEEYPQGVDWEAIVSDFKSLDFENGEDVNRNGLLKMGTLSEEDFTVLLEALDTVGVVYNIKDTDLTSVDEQNSIISIKSLNMSLTEEQISNGDSLEGLEEAKYYIKPKSNDQETIEINFKPDFLTRGVRKARDIDVEVLDTHTVVIGGLFKAIKVDKMRKIPLLGDLPLLGFAFRSEGERIAKAEIVTFLTFNLIEKE